MAKTGSILTVVEKIDILMVKSFVFKAHQLLLVNLFAFNFSFSQLLNLLFYNTP